LVNVIGPGEVVATRKAPSAAVCAVASPKVTTAPTTGRPVSPVTVPLTSTKGNVVVVVGGTVVVVVEVVVVVVAAVKAKPEQAVARIAMSAGAARVTRPG
jgi:hypothetical protein